MIVFIYDDIFKENENAENKKKPRDEVVGFLMVFEENIAVERRSIVKVERLRRLTKACRRLFNIR